MNIDTNALPALSLTTDRAVPGPRDTTLEIPPVVLPVLSPLQPLSVLANNTTALRDSFITEFQITKANPMAGGTQDICILSKGLWRIKLNMQSTTIGTAGTFRMNFWRTYILYQGDSVRLLGVVHLSTTLMNLSLACDHRFLLREDATIVLEWMAPAAAEFIGVVGSLVATREL